MNKILDINESDAKQASDAPKLLFLHPISDYGPAVHTLIQECPPLDHNSRYCNLLQCSHFADTCMAAFLGDQLVGFVSGYILPNKPDTLFIWQVAVSEVVRGRGVAPEMVRRLLASPSCTQVKFIETTITESNKASWRMFEKLAEGLKTSSNSSVFFQKDVHFEGHQDTEMLLRIGPFEPA